MTDRTCQNGSISETDPAPRLELENVFVAPEPDPHINGDGNHTGFSEDRPHPGGRPSKYTAEVVRVICEAVENGTPFRFAAALGGVSASTFYDWQRRFQEFSDAIQGALARGVEARLKLIRAAADNGDVRAAQWWLEHVLAEDFAKSRVEHGGEVGVTVTKMDDEVLQRLKAAYRMKIRREVEEELRSRALAAGSG